MAQHDRGEDVTRGSGRPAKVKKSRNSVLLVLASDVAGAHGGFLGPVLSMYRLLCKATLFDPCTVSLD